MRYQSSVFSGCGHLNKSLIYNFIIEVHKKLINLETPDDKTKLKHFKVENMSELLILEFMK